MNQTIEPLSVFRFIFLVSFRRIRSDDDTHRSEIQLADGLLLVFAWVWLRSDLIQNLNPPSAIRAGGRAGGKCGMLCCRSLSVWLFTSAWHGRRFLKLEIMAFMAFGLVGRRCICIFLYFYTYLLNQMGKKSGINGIKLHGIKWNETKWGKMG